MAIRPGFLLRGAQMRDPRDGIRTHGPRLQCCQPQRRGSRWHPGGDQPPDSPLNHSGTHRSSKGTRGPRLPTRRAPCPPIGCCATTSYQTETVNAMNTPIGANLWSFVKGHGDLANHNKEIELGYLFQADRSGAHWQGTTWGAVDFISPAAVRVPLILAERDPVSTRFGHIPPIAREVELVREFIKTCPIQRKYLSIVRLWEAK